MTATEFETTLRALMNKHPFLPFLIEYSDGRRVWVESRHVAFAGGGGSYIDDNLFIHFFDYTNVDRLTPVTLEAVK
jgi:hypothetical protein